uniref:Uncharacterized protein n=1 Tax=Candidatus Nitrotoga fabula TaxID=2182327 RepID=A0A2X0QW45_9PROT|nr:protein of unknown function [Candidatus Nitrotoga fabula]
MNMRQLRLVKRLVARLIVRMTQTGLFLIHALAPRHALVAIVRRHRDRFIEITDLQTWTRVSRHSKLHEQHADQRNECGNGAG